MMLNHLPLTSKLVPLLPDVPSTNLFKPLLPFAGVAFESTKLSLRALVKKKKKDLQKGQRRKKEKVFITQSKQLLFEL